MTGRELILHILKNNLEDEPIFKDGKFIGFMTVEEAAIKFDTGVETIKAWFELGVLEGFTMSDKIYICANAEHPILSLFAK